MKVFSVNIPSMSPGDVDGEYCLIGYCIGYSAELVKAELRLVIPWLPISVLEIDIVDTNGIVKKIEKYKKSWR